MTDEQLGRAWAELNGVEPRGEMDYDDGDFEIGIVWYWPDDTPLGLFDSPSCESKEDAYAQAGAAVRSMLANIRKLPLELAKEILVEAAHEEGKEAIIAFNSDDDPWKAILAWKYNSPLG